MKSRYKIVLLVVVLLAGAFALVSFADMGLPPEPIAGNRELMLNSQDLAQLGMAGAKSYDGNDCQTEQQTSIYSSEVQYSVCNYTIAGLDASLIVELKKFSIQEDLDGTYQYESSHLFSAQGLISEDTFGDKSRFRVSNENDYGGQYNQPGVYYYHLWIVKGHFLIHITSGGANETGEYVADTGLQILSKFQ
jgi:hypothetical protein